VVSRTKLSRVLCGTENGYFVYPELRHVFAGSDVLVALAAAESPTPLDQVIAAVSGNWPAGEGWRATALVTWLLKHGLLATAAL
jgi:hypothetical protein